MQHVITSITYKTNHLLMKILIALSLALISSFLNGVTLSVLWGWFLVPNLNIPAIGIVQAIGIALIVRLLVQQPDKPKDHSE